MHGLCLGPARPPPADNPPPDRGLSFCYQEFPMTISMSSASLPVFRTMLGNLSHVLDKGAAHAAAKKFDPAALLQARLAPDMLSFTRQIHVACDHAKNGIARLSGVEAPRFEDTESTFAELKARIQKTLDFLGTVPAERLDGTEDKEITFPVGALGNRTMKGEAYLKHWALPNFFFHVTTAYAILRHNGVTWARPISWPAEKPERRSGAGALASRCFERCEPLELGADVRHSARDEHAPGACRGSGGLHDAHHPQRPAQCFAAAGQSRPRCGERSGRLRPAKWLGGRANQPLNQAAQRRDQPTKGKQRDSHVTLLELQSLDMAGLTKGEGLRRVMAHCAPYARHLRHAPVLT
jgi:uncharacterized protein